MEKVIQNKSFCLLSNDYYKIVAEAASLWTTFPFSTDFSQKSWYRQGLFKKIRGYIVTGFKINWPDKTKSLTGIDIFDLLESSPIEMIFLENELYEKLLAIKSNACLIETSQYRQAKSKGPGFGTIPVFCHIGATLTKEITDDELRKIKSVDGFVGGVLE